MSLAFVHLLLSGLPVVLGRFAGLVCAVVESLHDVARVEEGGIAGELE